LWQRGLKAKLRSNIIGREPLLASSPHISTILKLSLTLREWIFEACCWRLFARAIAKFIQSLVALEKPCDTLRVGYLSHHRQTLCLRQFAMACQFAD
jgi:hypothetical protein